MGADLYIEKLYKKNEQKYLPLFEAAVKERDLCKRLGLSVEAEREQENVTKYYNLMYSEGYFRDSYNGSSLFAYLVLDDRLSWWQDITTLQNEKGEIKGENLINFLNLILAADLILPTKKELLENHCRVDGTGNWSVEEWHKYLIEKRQKLIEFICLAIETGDKIDASL